MSAENTEFTVPTTETTNKGTAIEVAFDDTPTTIDVDVTPEAHDILQKYAEASDLSQEASDAAALLSESQKKLSSGAIEASRIANENAAQFNWPQERLDDVHAQIQRQYADK